MSTIKDVASKAGVSIATVSRVLNNRGAISEATRKAVFQAMEELDYHPNEVARSLGKQRSKIIGLILPPLAHQFYAELATSIEDAAYRHGYKLMLCNSFFDSEKEKSYVEMLRRNMVDGIIVGSHTGETDYFKNSRLPIVSVETIISDDIPAVVSDNFQGGSLATRHLLAKGCKNLVHISGELRLKLSSDERADAFQKLCEQAGVRHHIFEATEQMLRDLNYSEIVARIFHEIPDVDGIFASSDIIAAECVKTCAALGYRVPEDVKIVGFDGISFSKMFHPPLTTIRQDIPALGLECVRQLLTSIAGDDVQKRTVLPVNLIERKTT